MKVIGDEVLGPLPAALADGPTEEVSHRRASGMEPSSPSWSLYWSPSVARE